MANLICISRIHLSQRSLFLSLSLSAACRNGDLRLQGSSIQSRGRVEICHNNMWGTICDNSWSSLDARIVCKQLGFSQIGEIDNR